MERMTDPVRMRTLFLFFSLNLLTIVGFSQNLERYNWYFGSGTQAIRFNRTSALPTVVAKSIPFGTGGSSTATDPSNANLLFYTDGSRVYDAKHLVMPGGIGLTANTSGNQPTAICPVPGQPGKYFIFTNTANFPAPGTISVSVVDMNLFGNAPFPVPATGDLESTNVAVPGLINRAEAMIIVPHTNGTDFWLLTQPTNTVNYSATLINAASYTGTFNTTTTAGIGPFPISAANFSFHEGNRKVAVSPQNTNTDAIIIDFNATTGGFGFDTIILNSGQATTTNQSIYDIEWSAKGDYLFLSMHGEAGIAANLLQYDYLNPLTTLATVLPGPIFRSYGVQIAPDSTIYHLYQAVAAGPFLVGQITKPDTIATEVRYLSAPLGPANFSGTQFTSFAPRTPVTMIVDFNFIGTCQNNNTTFFPIVSPVADSVRWDFGDLSGSNSWSPVHEFGAAQVFNVTLTAFYQNQTQSVIKAVSIQSFPLQLNLVQDTTACRSEFPPPRGTSSPTQFSVKVSATGGTPTSYIWSNGDLGDTLTPDSAGYYFVVATDGSGCSTYAGVNVKEYGLMDQRSNIWYFGDRAGINFNVNPPVPLNNSAMNAPEGCAIICDRNGNAIFYTDGTNVYNKVHALISTGIGGDPLASQSSIIVPVPGDETLFYIFTNESVNGVSGNTVKYSLFDIKQNGGLGAVVQQDLTLFSRSTERITASGRWLIIHEYGNNTFRLYPISGNGIGAPVLTSIGSDHLCVPVENNEGYMKFGPGNTLAVALSTPGTSNVVELFHVNDTTGRLSAYQRVDLKEPAGQVYGLEFSPGGNKIFATVKGPGTSNIFEYFIDSIGKAYFRQKIIQSAELGAIQRGPNGTLYVAVNGAGNGFLGTIQADEDTLASSSFTLNGFQLAATTTSRLGLPNFIQQISNATGGPGIEAIGFCMGTPTRFIGTPTDAIDTFFWFFGDGASDVQGTTEHTYAPPPNTYLVSLRLTNRCGLDTTMTRNVTIVAPPVTPTIPGAAVLCNGPVTLDANTANTPGLTYLWSSGATTQTVVISQQSIISVTNTDTTNGCTSNATSLVADNQPQLDLGPDQTLCQNSFTSALNAQNPGANYVWTVNGGAVTNAQSRALDTTLPGIFTYQVVVTDPITTCMVTDQATFTIIASPSFTITGTNPSACLGTDGTITVNLLPTAPATGPYSYFLTGPGGFNDQGINQTAPAMLNYNIPVVTLSIPAGTYSEVVTDQISGCTITQSIGLTDAVWTASAVATGCDPAAVTVSTAGAPVGVLQYRYTSPIHLPQGPFLGINTANLLSGDWVVEVRDGGGAGCIFTFNLNIPPAVETVAISSSLCTDPATLTATPSAAAISFAWTGPGIVTIPPTSPTVDINLSGLYTVTADIGGCPTVQTFFATYDRPTADFTQSDPCQNNVNLTASPSGPYTYRWYLNGSATISNIGRFISLGIADNGASYQSEVFNTLSGCASPKSVPKIVQVIGRVDAGVTATPACEDNQPFTLTAITTATGVTYAWYKDNVAIPGQTAPTTSQTDVATYKVEVSKSVCVASSQIGVRRSPLPIGLLPNSTVICNDKENTDPLTSQVDLDPGRFTRYDWFKNELTINHTLRVLTVDSEGLYRVDLTNSFGCVAPDEVNVLNDCLPKIDAPNAFRPGSTIDLNKNFLTFTRFITDGDFQIFIYSRWGDLVFTSPDRAFRWNGGLNNTLSQPLPGGSYSYVIRYVSSFHPERGIQEHRGGVALLR